MSNYYQLRLTIRKELEPELILKQYFMRHIVFPNPIHQGETITLGPDGKTKYILQAKVKDIEHKPGTSLGKSCLVADSNVFEENMSSVERILSEYDPQEF